VTSVVNALNGTVSTTYDKDGNVLTTSDEMGNVTTNQWNSRNELTQRTLPILVAGQSAPVLSWSYDANGNSQTSTDPLGRVTSYTWDKLNRMTKETLPVQVSGGQNPTITFAYDNLSRKTSETNALNQTATWTYANTDVSQVTKMTLPAPAQGQSSPVWTYAYDSLGRRYKTTDPMTHVQTTSFDADGRVTSVLDNLNHGSTNTYGHGAEVLTTSDSLSHTTTNQYDSRYRLIQTTDANSGVTQITLDGVGNRTKLIDPANNTTTWILDALNRPTSETNALGTTTTSYDASSDVTSITDADGRVRNFTFDNLHRLTAEQWMNGNTVVATMSYGYDAANQLTSASDPNSAYAFAYNGDGQVTSLDNNGTPNVPHVVLSSGYDLAGDRTSLSATIGGTADFLNNYAYDGDQRLTTVQQEQESGGNTVANKEVDFAYNALSQITTTTAYNTLSGPRTDVLTGAYTYDAGNRLTGLAYTSNGGANAIDTFAWGYDAANNVSSFTSIDGTATYGYDPTNQLTAATYTTNSGGHQPATDSYSFDHNGNRTNTGYSTGSDNLLTSDGTFNYQHDADGNQTVRTRISNNYATDYRATYTWDYRNRLTDVQYYNNNSVLTKHVHFVYDVFDHLLATEVDTTGSGSYNQIEHYLLDVSPEIPSAGVPGTALAQPVLKFDGNNNLTERFLEVMNRIYAEGSVSSRVQADTVTHDALDNLGTPRDIVSNGGALADHLVFSSFGQDVYESNSSVLHWAGFAGGHIDGNTGLVNNYHRWEDPAVGRWISQDPKGFAAGDANLVRYSGNSVTDVVDPSGLAGEVFPLDPGQNPSGSWPIGLYALMANLTAEEEDHAAQGGCGALNQVACGMPLIGSGGMTTVAPGVTMFSNPTNSVAQNYNGAVDFYKMQQAAGNNPTLFAYQNTSPMPGTSPVTPIPTPLDGAYNYATLMYSKLYDQWYWQYMNNGATEGNQTVFHDPLNVNAPDGLLGLPGGNPTTVFGVYVAPPAPPQPQPSYWQKMLDSLMASFYLSGGFAE
jgi:RHS repeat-associated protein